MTPFLRGVSAKDQAEQFGVAEGSGTLDYQLFTRAVVFCPIFDGCCSGSIIGGRRLAFFNINYYFVYLKRESEIPKVFSRLSVQSGINTE